MLRETGRVQETELAELDAAMIASGGLCNTSHRMSRALKGLPFMAWF